MWNVTSSTKPEVHNLSHCRQRKTEPRPRVTCTENLVKFGHIVFELCERTYKQTDKQTRWSQYFAHVSEQSNKCVAKEMYSHAIFNDNRWRHESESAGLNQFDNYYYLDHIKTNITSARNSCCLPWYSRPLASSSWVLHFSARQFLWRTCKARETVNLLLACNIAKVHRFRKFFYHRFSHKFIAKQSL